MSSQVLREARKYEELKEQTIAQKERPLFHLSSRVVWMNDPNGFSYYAGKYHLFYQYHPYDTCWGPMHWGHAVSSDLLRWEYLPAALAPDTACDSDGCFSGGALEAENGQHMLIYTGVSRQAQENGEVRDIQTQCVAFGDGIDYRKYHKNPVVDIKDLPADSSRFDFRDPKLWKGCDGQYYFVAANNRADESGGRILLFSSLDGLDWHFESILFENDGSFGKMWECPDFFELDGRWILLVSPQDMLPKDFEYHNGDGNLCFIGDLDRKTKTFLPTADQAVDYGIDFYAAQTLLTADGRRVMIAWMQNWDTCNNNHQSKRKWFGQMCTPRELRVQNGRLFQRPVRELEAFRRNPVTYTNVLVQDIVTLEGIKGRTADLELELSPENSEEIYRKFEIHLAKNDQYHTSVSFRPYESILKLDRKFSGSRRAIIHQRRCRVARNGGKLKLRILIDRFSVELFVNDGEQAMSATIYTDMAADGISFYADGNVRMNLSKYDICMG